MKLDPFESAPLLIFPWFDGVRFEMPPDGVPVDTPPPADDAPPPDDSPAPDDAPPPADVQAFDWDDPAVQERVAGMSRQQSIDLLAELGLVSFDQPKADGPPAPDPLSDTYAADLEAWYEAKQAQANAPINAYIEAQQAERTNAVIDGEIATALTAANLEGIDAGLLRSVAAQFAAQPEYAKYGATIEGVKATAKAAADWIVSQRTSAGEAAVAAYKESLKNPAPGATPYEPGIRGAAIPSDGGAMSELDVARNFRSRQPA